MKENKKILENIFLKIDKFVPKKWRWILNHEGFKRYFVNTGWMFFGQMFSLGIAFFVGVWMARYLGPENYGVLNYAMAFTGLFAFISTLGVDGILSRDLVKYPEKRDELMGTSFRLKLIGGFLALLVSSIVIFSIESSPLIKFLVVLHSFTFVFHSFNVILIFFQSNVEAKKNVKAQLSASVIASILKVVMIVSGMGVIWLVAIYVLESILLSVFLIISYKSSKLRIMDWKFKYPLAKKILSGSWLLMLTSVSVSIYMRIDQVIIKMMIDESAVGIYSVATKLSEVWNLIPTIICASFFPAIINARKTDRASYASR
ncbi:MAG: flippase [Patescibacteria group bacterium]